MPSLRFVYYMCCTLHLCTRIQTYIHTKFYTVSFGWCISRMWETNTLNLLSFSFHGNEINMKAFYSEQNFQCFENTEKKSLSKCFKNPERKV